MFFSHLLFPACFTAVVVGTAISAPFLQNASLSNPSLLKVPTIVDDSTYTITYPMLPGKSLTGLVPTFSVAPGYTASPPSGAKLNLREPRKIHISSANGTRVETWTVSAVHMGSPALPGLYADPNIVSFDGTYYIYATTDGFPGWGGQTFYVWSSKDLVAWTRTVDPVLTLNGTSGNVPWSDGNAWAPTIHHRGGTYYLYFSGNNPTYNRKTIGVATAPCPTGPFTAQPTAMITNNERLTASQAIDPAAFVDPKTGKHYLFWGNGNPLYAELNDDMISINEDTLANVEGLTDFTEASFIVYREPYYHYTYSNGNTGLASYYVGYATANSINGPWTYHGHVLDERQQEGILATGSSSSVNVPGTDDWYMAYHRFHIPGGDGTDREICIDKIEFDHSLGLMWPVVPTLAGVKAQDA